MAVGDRVVGAAMCGAFAEQIAVPSHRCNGRRGGRPATGRRVRRGHRTSYLALRTVADVAPGDWVVVLGAAGGVGLAAVELAHVLGAQVLAAASTAEKLAVCVEKGADSTVNYATENLKERIKQITGAGADVVIDPVGGPWAEQALRSMKWGGRFVSVGFASGEIPRIPLNLVLLKGPVITGFTMRAWPRTGPEDVARDEAELWDLLATGKVTPHVGRPSPLEEGARALVELATRRATGKVLIEPGRRRRNAEVTGSVGPRHGRGLPVPGRVPWGSLRETADHRCRWARHGAVHSGRSASRRNTATWPGGRSPSTGSRRCSSTVTPPASSGVWARCARPGRSVLRPPRHRSRDRGRHGCLRSPPPTLVDGRAGHRA
jgi:NADPH2:quinone reductase